MVSTDAPPAAPRARAAPSGARSGALLAAASLAATALNYVFLVAAGRLLGTSDYGDLAALTGLLTVILLPTGALQLAVSREVARELALDNRQGADAFGRAAVRLGLFVTVPLVALGLALAAPLRNLLHIRSTGVVVLAMLGLLAALVFPIASGILQGYQRFNDIAALYVTPFLLRLVLLALLAAAGYRLGGAMFAASLGGLGGAALALALASDSLKRGARVARPSLRPFLRYLWPVLVGLIGIAVLTNLDLLVVKARFPGDTGGHYAVASAFARVAFFLPATILAVLFPRTVARQARGEDSADILGRSLLVTAGFGGALTLLYAMAGRGLVVASFGRDFAPAGGLIAPLAIAMTLFALANVLVGFHLSRDETRYAWIVAGAIPVQVLALALVPHSVRTVIWADVAVAAALLAAHELLVEPSLPALRAGGRLLFAGVNVSKAAVVEAVVVLAGATAVACVLLRPLVEHIGSTIVGRPGSDSTGTIAGIWEVRHETGFHLLGITHHTLTAAPFGWDESNALNLQTLLAYYPTYLLAHVIGDVAAFNVSAIAGYALSGAAMYWLVRYLGCARAVAAWAGLVYILFPWHVARAEHVSLLHLEMFPLLVLSLVAAARRPTWFRFALVAAANLACWIMSGYFGPQAAITTIAFSVGAAFVSERWQRRRLLLGATASALAAVVLVGAAAVVSGTNAGAGLKRVSGDLHVFGIRPLELVVPPARSLLFGNPLDAFWLGREHGSNPTEITNYLGLLTIALAILGVVVAVSRRADHTATARTAALGLLVSFAVGLAFALPSPLFDHVPGAARLLWAAVPAFRVPSRWSPLLMTALLPIAALGLQWIWRVAVRERGRGLALGLVATAIVLSVLELSLKTPQHFRTVPVPAEYAALDRAPPGILAEYPLGYSDVFRLWQLHHGRPLLNGALPDTPADRARLVLLDPAEPGTAENLALLGVTAIGIHPGAHVDAELPPRQPAGNDGYRLLGRFPDGASMWQIVARPAPALATYEPGGFGPPERREDGFVGFPLVSPEGVGVIDLAAKHAGVIRLVFDAAPPEGKQQVLRLADASGEQAFTLRGKTRVSVDVAVPAGSSQLLAKTDPAATSAADAIFLSPPRAERTNSAPALHATPTAPTPGF